MDDVKTFTDWLKEVPGVDDVKRMDYEGQDLLTFLAMVHEDSYTPFTQTNIALVAAGFAPGNEPYHIADVHVDEGIWSFEIAPVSVGNLPQDVGVSMT